MNRGASASPEGIVRLKTAQGLFQDGRLTYEKIAEKVGTTSKTVSRFFRGIAVERSNAYAIITYLGLTHEEVLSAEDLLVEQSIRKIKEADTDTAEQAQELISQLSTALDKLKEEEENSLPAMEWLKSHRIPLSQGAAEAVLNDDDTAQNSVIEDLDISGFASEIRKYLQLIYFCLEVGSWDVIDAAIEQSLVPNSRDVFLYTKALSFIRGKADIQILSNDSRQLLNLCIDYLIQVLPFRL
jgi:transcriptional regulator with XRE-family HTH domain